MTKDDKVFIDTITRFREDKTSLIQSIKLCTNTVLFNEKPFLDKFCLDRHKFTYDELLSYYMSFPDSCIVYTTISGEEVTRMVNTQATINWVDEFNGLK